MCDVFHQLLCPLHKPSGQKKRVKKRAEMWALCTRKTKKSKSRESIAPWIENGPKMDRKKRAFYFRKMPDHVCFHWDKNMEKSADARFFRSIYSFFWTFLNVQNPKKMEKCPKNRIFPYALRRFFQHFHVTRKANIFLNNSSKKNLKKT